MGGAGWVQLEGVGSREAYAAEFRAEVLAACSRWETTTFLGALRAEGFIAPRTIEGPLNGPLFRAWVEQELAPLWRPGDIVVMNNLSSHKVAGVREAITAVGAELRYLPPYSPDLPPLRWRFPNSKNDSAMAQPARSTSSGNSAAQSSTSSPNPSAEIISSTAVTARPKRKPLSWRNPEVGKHLPRAWLFPLGTLCCWVPYVSVPPVSDILVAQTRTRPKGI